MSSSSLVSIDSVTYLSTPLTIPTQEEVLSWNRDLTGTSRVHWSSWLQTFMSKTCPILVFLRIHPLVRVFFSFPGIVYSRNKCCICSPSCVSREEKYCLVSTSFKPHQNIVWIISGLLTCVRIFARILAPSFTRCCALVEISAIERSVGISIFSKWLGASRFPEAPPSDTPLHSQKSPCEKQLDVYMTTIEVYWLLAPFFAS